MNSIYVLALMSLIGVAAAYDGAGQLCRLEEDAPEVTTTDELMEVVSTLRYESNLNCAEGVVNAITGLEYLEYKEVCSHEATDNFYIYWNKYGAKGAQFAAYLPVQLRKFLQAYGLQVSKLCKTALVDNLEKVTQEKGITEEDFRVVTQDIKEEKFVNIHLGKEPRIEEVFILPPPGSSSKIYDQYLSPKHHKYYEIVRERCIKKFNPIWKSLIGPVTRLAIMGFNYKEDSLNARVHELIKKPIWWDWFHVVLQCAPMLNQNLIKAAKKKVNKNKKVKLIKYLEEEEEKELKEKLGAAYDEQTIKQVDYKNDVTLNNQIIDKNDAHMTKLIMKQGKEWFGETSKMVWRIAMRAPRVINFWLHIKSNQFGMKDVEIDIPKKH